MLPLGTRFVVAALTFAVTAVSQKVRVGQTGRVFDGEGKPTADAKVTLVSGSQYGDEGDVVHVDSDAGTIELQPLPALRDGQVFVFAKGMLVHVAGSLRSKSVALPKPQRLRVRIVDVQGAPSVGATFASSGALSRGGGTPEDRPLVYVGQHVTRWLLSARTSDRDGCADLPFLTGRGTQFNVIVPRGTQRSPNTWLEANDGRIDIELR